MDHSKFLSPSSAPALLSCAYYERTEEDSENAKRGRELHAEFEKALKEDNPDLLENEGLSWAYEQIIYIKGEHFNNKILELGHNYFIEEKLIVEDEYMNEVTFGTADLLIENVLIDLKTGFKERDYSTQMALYALGAMQRFMYEEIKVYLLYSELKVVESFTITRKDAEEVLALLLKIKTEKERFCKKKSEYCSWCKHFVTCEEANVDIKGVIKEYTGEVVNYHSSQLTCPKEMGRLLTISRDFMKKWCDAVEFHAKQMAEGGIIPEGFEYKEKRGNKKINNLFELYKKAKENNVEDKEFFNNCSMSLTNSKKVFKLKGKEFDNLVEPFCSRGASTKQLTKKKVKESKDA